VKFDQEGHVVLSPKDVQDQLDKCEALASQWLLPGTPLLFDTHANFHRFLSFIADELYIPPMNVCVRGSGKIGFSIAPRAHKIWMASGPACDVDIGIVDIDYFNMIDREVKRWMRRASTNDARDVAKKVRKTLKYQYLRYFDLPEEIPVVAEHNDCFRRAGDVVHCVKGRVVTAFIYRDWWSVCSRYTFDLEQLRKALVREQSPLPSATDTPRPYQPSPLGADGDD